MPGIHVDAIGASKEKKRHDQRRIGEISKQFFAANCDRADSAFIECTPKWIWTVSHPD